MDLSRAFACAWMTVMLFPLASEDAVAAPARLVKDINQAPSSDRSASPDTIRRLGDIALFRASTPASGLELWRTDGTAAGTFQVKDLWPGPVHGLSWFSSNRPVDLVEVNGALVFPANDGVHGVEIWRSDGTAAGTFMLKDILPGGGSGLRNVFARDPNSLIWNNAVSGDLLYFLADDGEHGVELWRTDGTAGGTFLLRDINAGEGPPDRGGRGDREFRPPRRGASPPALRGG